MGELNGKRGRFPSNYCEVINQPVLPKLDAPKTQVKVLYDFEAKKREHISLKRGDVITVLEKRESGWWIGELNEQKGKFPSNYVEEFQGER